MHLGKEGLIESAVFRTFALKLGAALSSFVLLGMTTHLLGAAGRGTISLVVTTIGLSGLVNGFVGGA